jgi:hypothetical protein
MSPINSRCLSGWELRYRPLGHTAMRFPMSDPARNLKASFLGVVDWLFALITRPKCDVVADDTRLELNNGRGLDFGFDLQNHRHFLPCGRSCHSQMKNRPTMFRDTEGRFG